jgi:hypothetical protein
MVRLIIGVDGRVTSMSLEGLGEFEKVKEG